MLAESLEPHGQQRGHNRNPSEGQRLSLQSWRFRDIRWKFVFGNQHYGTLVLTIFPAVALGVILFGLGEEPVGDNLENILQLRTYNWGKTKGSIPAVVAVLVPVVYFLLVLVCVEFYLYRTYHKHITNAVYAVLFFVIAWFSTFIVHIFAQQISAIVVAEPRPDFWTRCNPMKGQFKCTGNTSDGFASFFSGHASSSMVTAVYSTIYLLWSIYFRPDGLKSKKTPQLFRILKRRSEGLGLMNRLLHEIGHGVVMYIIILQLGFAWIVGVSRVIDNRHHIWDVNSGLIVGGLVGAVFGCHAIGLYKLMPKYREGAPRDSVEMQVLEDAQED